MAGKIDNLQGSLELLILKTLERGPNHGFGITAHVQTASDGLLQIEEGSLYPALHRLERRGWVKARWAATENNRRAKYYELTREGRKQLALETKSWHTLTAVVGQILDRA